jgi:signal transduction histidine kinase/response regulator RpfG family c-di-GMP phosphodiesterase
MSWDGESREFVLVVDARGTVTDRDRRTAAKLNLNPGDSLLARAVPGTEQKLANFLGRALEQPQANVELSLTADGKAVTCSFHARPEGSDCVALLGSWLPEEYSRSLQQVHESMEEVANLNRRVVVQKAALEKTLSELSDSNKGITVLHQELEDKAEVLQRTAEVRSRVVANVSHEFRTPLHSILGLSRLMLDGIDGELNPEQRKQLQFIRTSAEELSAMVDDLLDLAAAETGKVVMRPEKFLVSDFVSALRGTLRPLIPAGSAVDLVFVDPPPELQMETDQSKLGQILRNLVSNALKFTEQGTVEVSVDTRRDDVIFNVRDSGIGVAEEHFDRIFEEFGQIDGAIQSRVKGTGLGLPLSRRLAELLGGVLTVESEVGKGSLFTVRVPRVHAEVRALSDIQARPLDPNIPQVLVVEDDRKTIFVYERYLANAGFQVVPARSIADAERLLEKLEPAAILLDIMLDGESSWNFLARLKSDPATHDIPVLVVTVTNKEQKARALGADEFWLKPVDQDRLTRKLRALKADEDARVLIIDDDDRARYLMTRFLEKGPYELIEAGSGATGIEAAREHRPNVILLDFVLQDMTAFDVLDELKSDPLTRSIPVIVVTSLDLDQQERERLLQQTEVILSKQSLSREIAIRRIRDALRKADVGSSRTNHLSS